jgi:hypothetical protein
MIMGGTSELNKIPHGGKLEAYLRQLPEAAGSSKKYTRGNDLDNCTVPLIGESGEQEYEMADFNSYKVAAKELCRNAGIENVDSVEKRFSDKVQTTFKNFFDDLSNFGRTEDSRTPPSVATGMVSILGGLIPVAGVNVGAIFAFSLNKICNELASIFKSTSEEVARTIFSGFCIASTAIRAALPIVVEMVRVSNNPEEKFICLVATAVMASVYLVTSSISVLLAGHHAILNSPTTLAMASKVKIKNDSLDKDNIADFKQIAQDSLKTIGQMLTDWKADVSANFLSLGREFLMLSGAVFSALSALSKFAPILAIPFASIITGSISLVANVAEIVQGIIEYTNQKNRLQTLKEEIQSENDPSNKIRKEEEIRKLENQLKLSVVRIAKGGLNVLISIASIVFGVLALGSFSVPFLPAILAAVSLTSVLILSVAGLVVRKMNNADAAENAQETAGEKKAEDPTGADGARNSENPSGEAASERRDVVYKSSDAPHASSTAKKRDSNKRNNSEENLNDADNINSYSENGQRGRTQSSSPKPVLQQDPV